MLFRSIGFSSASLRLTFALRFAMTALLGSVAGTALAAVFADPIVSSVMKLVGISNFSSNPNVIAVALPAVAVTILFTGFGWLSAGKIKLVPFTVLIAEL